MHETDTSAGLKALGLEEIQTSVKAVEVFQGDTTLVVGPQQLRDVLSFLKTTKHYAMLLDIVGMDYSKYSIEQTDRFAVIYILMSLETHTRIRVKVFVSEEACEVPSMHELFASANWCEREVDGVFGVGFRGHRNLVRILCHQEFEGHPLRKDYPSDQYQRLKTAVPSTDI